MHQTEDNLLKCDLSFLTELFILLGVPVKVCDVTNMS